MKDKLLTWENGFPYWVARKSGITPASSMSDVKKASLKIMGPNFTPQLYQALDELRIIKRRLFVDFFLYQIKGEIVSPELLDKEIAASIQAVGDYELAPYLTPDTSELQTMANDFNEINLPEVHLEYLDWPDQDLPDWEDYVEFDS